MKAFYKKSRNKSGIYKITNTRNNKFYIGSTVNFASRKSSHHRTLLKNNHSNHHLQASFNKYGEEAFVFEVIEVVKGNRTNILETEQKYLDKCFGKKYCYNKQPKAESSIGRKLSEEHKKKISASKKGNQYALGHEPSIEARNIMSQKTKGKNHPFFGKQHSNKTKELMSLKTPKPIN